MSQTKLSELSENEEMIVPVNAIYAIAWRSLKKIQQVKFMKKFDVWLRFVWMSLDRPNDFLFTLRHRRHAGGQ